MIALEQHKEKTYDKELVGKLKKELAYLGVLFLTAFIIFQIAFYKEKVLVNLRVVFSVFWLFVLPGFYLLYNWHEKLSFIERVFLGIAVSTAVIALFSYYLGLAGLHIKSHHILLPVVFLLVDGVILYRKAGIARIKLHKT